MYVLSTIVGWTIKSKKVKVTLVQALRLCTGRTAHRGSRGIALPFHDHGTRRGCGVSVTSRPLFTPGKDPVPIAQGVGWGPGPVWTSAENVATTGIRFPDRPARSQSLYRLTYPAHRRRYTSMILSSMNEQIKMMAYNRSYKYFKIFIILLGFPRIDRKLFVMRIEKQHTFL